MLAACTTPTSSGSADLAPASPTTSSSTSIGDVIVQQRPVSEVRTGTSTSDLPLTCAPNRCTPSDLAASKLVLKGPLGFRYALGPIICDQHNIESVTASPSSVQPDVWVVDVVLDETGAEALASATTTAVSSATPENELALVVGGMVVSAPVVRTPITSGRFQVSGFDRQDAEALAAQLSG